MQRNANPLFYLKIAYNQQYQYGTRNNWWSSSDIRAT